jgi:alkylation response protein AidB-like acyl-CoA dehydrogenase
VKEPTIMPQDLNFALTAEQLEMRSSIRSFVAARSPITTARAHQDGTIDRADRDLWVRLSDQYGAQGMCVPETLGGLGLGLDDLCVVLSEMGASLVAGPYWETVALATPLLLSAEPSAERDRWLRGIAAGETAATVAFMTASGMSPSRAVSAAKTGAGWHLTGRASLVLDADIADLVLVVAESVEGLRVFAAPAAGADLKPSSADSIDPTRPLFDIELDHVAATPLVHAQGAEAALAAALDYACVALGAEQVGAARRCLDQAVEYTKQRVQFGRPIGAFQAVQHRCANALIAIEGADSAVFYAAWAHRDGAAEFPMAASVAKIAASDALVEAAADFVHLSGTMGYTREHDAQLYYRRAKWASLFLGSSAAHRSRVADLLGV